MGWEQEESAGGRVAYVYEIGEDREDDCYPGCCVRYGQCDDGYWRVEVYFIGDASRYSDAFATQDCARMGAEAVVSALRTLWPDPPISYGRRK